jgi:hypothetical protein
LKGDLTMNSMMNISRGNSRWRALGQALVLGGFLLTSLTASADNIAISTLLPPYHSEEALTWCGPATGQMVITGYPTSARKKLPRRRAPLAGSG